MGTGDAMSVRDSDEPHKGFTSVSPGNIISSTESFINYFQQPVGRFKYQRFRVGRVIRLISPPGLKMLTLSKCFHQSASVFDNLGGRAATRHTPHI